MFLGTCHLSSTGASVVATKKEVPLTDWAAMQIRTSVSWSNSVFTHALGALNYQIEHHLFPGISHVHYEKLAPIVQQTCEEFQVPYRLYSGFWKALFAHIQALRALGREPRVEKMK